MATRRAWSWQHDTLTVLARNIARARPDRGRGPPRRPRPSTSASSTRRPGRTGSGSPTCSTCGCRTRTSTGQLTLLRPGRHTATSGRPRRAWPSRGHPSSTRRSGEAATGADRAARRPREHLRRRSATRPATGLPLAISWPTTAWWSTSTSPTTTATSWLRPRLDRRPTRRRPSSHPRPAGATSAPDHPRPAAARPGLDGSVRGKAYAFLAKLAENDTLPGLHIEPIVHAVDPRVRTGRVDQFWRAVLFKVQGQADEAMYVYLGVWPHDDAVEFAHAGAAPGQPGQRHRRAAARAMLRPSRPAGRREPSPRLPATRGEPLLVALGHTASDLVDELGLDPELVELAMEVHRPRTRCSTLAEVATGWQGVALIDLAPGRAIEQVREAARHRRGATSRRSTTTRTPHSPRRCTHPAARLQFAFVEDDDELRRAIEDDDFAGLARVPAPGAARTPSAPGRGRSGSPAAPAPARPSCCCTGRGTSPEATPRPRILLTTFNKTLADALQRDLKVLDPTLPIADRLGDAGRPRARRRRGGARRPPGRTPRSPAAVDRGARQPHQRDRQHHRRATRGGTRSRATGPGLPADLRSPAFFQAEYATVVLPSRVTTLRGVRQGAPTRSWRRRSTAPARAAVWKVVASYRLNAGIHGSIDFAEAAAIAAEVLDESGDRPFDHVLVDEGQDLGPTHWQFLRALVAEGPDDLFIAEDSHQRIYGQTGRPRSLRHQDRRPLPAAAPQLPHHRAEPSLRRQRADGHGVRRPRGAGGGRHATTAPRAPVPSAPRPAALRAGGAGPAPRSSRTWLGDGVRPRDDRPAGPHRARG